VSWWPEPAPSEPRPDELESKIVLSAGLTSTGAVGDKLAISASDTQLELRQLGHAQFLGWGEDTAGTISAVGDGFELMLRDGHVLGLDRQLQLQYSEDFVAESYVEPEWIDANHTIVSRRVDDQYKVTIVDPAGHQPAFVLATFDTVGTVAYLPALREVAAVSDSGVHRYTLDAQFTHPVELGTLGGTANQIRLVDPSTHNGIVAVGMTSESGRSWRLLTWRDGGLDIKVAPSSQVEDGSSFKAFDANGTAYMTTEDELESIRDTEVTHLGRASLSTFVVPSADGQLIATLDESELAMRDAQGHELWRRPMWNTEAFAFSTDERRLAVQTTGGLVVVDAQTGERLASACAFQFGLHDTNAHWFPRGTPTVCED
jgi:hypothetical protein